MTPEGFSAHLSIPVSHDGKRIAAFNLQTRSWDLCQIEDGKCAPLSGLEKQDDPLQWSAAGNYLYVAWQGPVPGIWRIETSTGRDQLWKHFAPADPAGVYATIPNSVTPDGKSYAVQYVRSLDQLFVADGAN